MFEACANQEFLTIRCILSTETANGDCSCLVEIHPLTPSSPCEQTPEPRELVGELIVPPAGGSLSRGKQGRERDWRRRRRQQPLRQSGKIFRRRRDWGPNRRRRTLIQGDGQPHALPKGGGCAGGVSPDPIDGIVHDLVSPHDETGRTAPFPAPPRQTNEKSSPEPGVVLDCLRFITASAGGPPEDLRGRAPRRRRDR